MNPIRTRDAVTARDVVERGTSGDLVAPAVGRGPVPSYVGAVLRLAGIPGGDPATLGRLVAERAAAIPRLRQRLVRVPLGCGRRSGWTTRPPIQPGMYG